MAYFAGARGDFVDMLPTAVTGAILEIGCGSGDTGALALSSGKCSVYCGVELDRKSATLAESLLSEVVCGDVESVDLPWNEGTFDAVILSEVLEHLTDPWDCMKRVGRLVRPGGMVLASLPNVSH